MAEGATTGELTDTCEIITKTTAMNATTKDDVIVRSAPRQVMVEVLGETRMDENYDILDRDETTKRKVSTELLDMPQKFITRGFLELAEEARIVGVTKTPSVLMNEVLPQITEITSPMGIPISWKINGGYGTVG